MNAKTLHYFPLEFNQNAFLQQNKGVAADSAFLLKLWQLVQPMVFWRETAVLGNDGEKIYANDFTIESLYVAKGLKDCPKMTVLAVTIGEKLPQYAAELLACGKYYQATVADLLGSYGAEHLAATFCDYLQWEKQKDGLYQTLRYSPGYGDWALAKQPEILAYLNCQKISCNDNFLLSPVKSITAVLGWSTAIPDTDYPTGRRSAGFCNGGHNCAACNTWACMKGVKP